MNQCLIHGVRILTSLSLGILWIHCLDRTKNCQGLLCVHWQITVTNYSNLFFLFVGRLQLLHSSNMVCMQLCFFCRSFACTSGNPHFLCQSNQGLTWWGQLSVFTSCTIISGSYGRPTMFLLFKFFHQILNGRILQSVSGHQTAKLSLPWLYELRFHVLVDDCIVHHNKTTNSQLQQMSRLLYNIIKWLTYACTRLECINISTKLQTYTYAHLESLWHRPSWFHHSSHRSRYVNIKFGLIMPITSISITWGQERVGHIYEQKFVKNIFIPFAMDSWRIHISWKNVTYFR